MNSYVRRVSGFERIKLVSNELCPPYCNQLLLDGTGTLAPELWRAAAKRAAEVNPGCRLVLRRRLGQLVWKAIGPPPPVVEVDGTGWSGFDLKGADFLKRPFSPEEGPTCEILLIHGNPPRVAFRTLHAVMDMRGTLSWIEDVFRALRKDPPLGAYSTLTDFGLSRSVKNVLPKRDIRVEADAIPVTRRDRSAPAGFEWRRIQLQGRYSSLLPQVALLVAREAWKHAEGKVRFLLPVDLRRNRPEVRSTGNLTRNLTVEVGPGTTLQDVIGDVKQQLEAAQECYVPRARYLGEILPLWLIRAFMRVAGPRAQARGTYLATAVLSNINRMSLEGFQGGGFIANRYYGIPPFSDNISCFLGLVGYSNTVEIIASMPMEFASEGRIDRFMEALRTGLVAKPGTDAA